MSGVLNPQGPIALQERNLIITAVILMLIVAIPLLIMLYTIAWKYRSANKNVKRDPEKTGGFFGQIVWWAIPAVIVIVLGIINWKSTHALDPYKPIISDTKPMVIQVVALDWKWLFIYPQENIASVNFIEFPAGTPVHFDLTADAPMNSFWIPQLGSQIYAMSGMMTQLNLEASAPGEFPGKAAEINGDGYAGMNFMAKAVSQSDFDAWVQGIQQESSTLDESSYSSLLAPSESNPPSFYSSVDKALYNSIIMKYMVPSQSTSSMTNMQDMNM